MKFLPHLFAVALILSLANTGCKSTKPPVTDLGGKDGTSTTKDPGAGPAYKSNGEPGGGEVASFDPDAMQQDRGALAAQTIYFDFDSSSIRSGDQPKLEAVASTLKSDSSAKLLIEGNCDERGTEEYNRSLGEKRALAARESLATMGIDPNRIATRSFGEDHPSATGHDESAWGKNRRDEFVLLHPR